MRSISILALATGFSMTMAGVADAEQAAGQVAKYCAADIEQYCADKRQDNGEVRVCLVDNKDKLSITCQKTLELSTGTLGKRGG